MQAIYGKFSCFTHNTVYNYTIDYENCCKNCTYAGTAKLSQRAKQNENLKRRKQQGAKENEHVENALEQL